MRSHYPQSPDIIIYLFCQFADLLAGVAGAKKDGRSSSRSGHARDRGLGYRLRDTGQVAENILNLHVRS